jgi:SAM-dependent methyltransferase
MNAELLERVFERARAVQTRHDGGRIEPLKRAAKRVCTDLINQRLASGARVLDVGGEGFYHADLVRFQVVVANLPDADMHELDYEGQFEAVIAMHVLEHSPCPLYVLHLLRRALVPGGLLYAAVPRPSPRICSGFGHWSVMPAVMWRPLIEAAGFQIESATSGKFGARPDWIEERFLASTSP